MAIFQIEFVAGRASLHRFQNRGGLGRFNRIGRVETRKFRDYVSGQVGWISFF